MHRIVICFTLLSCLHPAVACAQSGAVAPEPIGHWVADHPSKGGIGSWWEFRADGSLTLTIGAMVTTSFSRSGDTLTMPSPTVGGPLSVVRMTVNGDVLSLRSGDKEVRYRRIGVAPVASDPLLGKWHPEAPASPSSDPNAAALERAQANATYLFTADGKEIVRIPFLVRAGTWDKATHTLQVQVDPATYGYQLSGTTLLLDQPPDGKTRDSYSPDPLFQ